MSNQWEWSDRRALFQRGRDVHEPTSPTERRKSGAGVTDAIRRASVTSNSGLEKTTSNTTASTSTSTGEPTSPSGQRRRSSNTALFGNLNTMKRGSEDYNERRMSHTDSQPGTMFSGWYNKTFKGLQGQQPAGDATSTAQSGRQNDRRGVME